MYEREDIQGKERKGFVAIATLIIMATAVAVASLTFAPANKVFGNNALLINLCRRDDIALQAQLISEQWLKRAISDGIIPSPPKRGDKLLPNLSPTYEVPYASLAQLYGNNSNTKITARVIDMHYLASSEVLSAAEVPRIKAHFFTEVENGRERKYSARHYMIDVTVVLDASPRSKTVLQRELIALRDEADKIYYIRGNIRKLFI